MLRQGRTRVVRVTRPGESSSTNINLCGYIFLIIFGSLFFIGIPVGLVKTELNYYEMSMAFDEVKEIVTTVPTDRDPSPYKSGEVIHFTSHHVETDTILADRDFQIEAEINTLKMKRVPEFCQWQESYTESEHEDSNGNKVVTRTYYYYKGWFPFPVISTFFDQPFAHHNPQRNPFPVQSWNVPQCKLGDYTANAELIQSINSFVPIQFHPNSLENFYTSPAVAENFKYIGNGYFYSAYEASGMEMIAKLSGRFLEGSLNIQLADLFSTCEAGDIRIQYQYVHPSTVSVVGLQLDSQGNIGAYTSTRGFKVALMEEGEHSAEEVLDNALSEYLHWNVWVWRALLIVWSYVLYIFVIQPGYPEPTRFFISVAFSFSLLGSLWLCTWGISILSVLAFVSLLILFPMACLAVYQSYYPSSPSYIPPPSKPKSG